MIQLPLNIGDPAPDFELPGVDEKTYTLESFADKDILGLMFMCVHCPTVKIYEDRLIATQNDYAARGVQMVGINPNDSVKYPEDSFESMTRRAKEMAYPFPYLRDKSQTVAEAYGAQTTPDLFIFDKERILRYRGRLDDNRDDPSAVQQQYVRAAFEALLAGVEPSQSFVPPVGCSIKWAD